MRSLTEVVATPEGRQRVIADVVQLIDREVESRSGLTGMAIRTAYSMVRGLKQGRMIPEVVEGMLDEFIAGIEPLHAEHRAGASGGFDAFLQRHPERAINALLHVTDARARRTSHQVLRSAYQKLRPMAEKQVAQSLPGVGRMIDTHCAA
jgi:hypothetical protein